MNVIRLAELRDEPLSLDEVLAAVSDPGVGGIAIFAGTVRDSDGGRDVAGLSYSAHPTAEAELRRLAGKVAAGFGLRALAAVHRVGDLGVGDIAVLVAAAAAHRGEALAACRVMIDELKHTIPVWKHQEFADGSSEWVNGA